MTTFRKTFYFKRNIQKYDPTLVRIFLIVELNPYFPTIIFIVPQIDFCVAMCYVIKQNYLNFYVVYGFSCKFYLDIFSMRKNYIETVSYKILMKF